MLVSKDAYSPGFRFDVVADLFAGASGVAAGLGASFGASTAAVGVGTGSTGAGSAEGAGGGSAAFSSVVVLLEQAVKPANNKTAIQFFMEDSLR